MVVMRTTLDLPNELLEEALKITNEKNRTSLIVNSVKSTIRRYKLAELIKKQGTIPLDIDLEQLRKRRSESSSR
jgi:hypothetical protein